MLTKTDIYEILGREVDEIDDIRRAFESSYRVTYSNPEDGDFISDDYNKIIDLSTQPNQLKPQDLRILNRSIEHLNGVYPTIEKRLGRAGLLDSYQNVAEQINNLNSADPNRANVTPMQVSSDA